MENISNNKSMPSRYRFFSLRNISAVFVIIWLVAQIVVVTIYWDLPAYSDSAAYRRLALESSDAGWYPLINHLYSENYIFNPGYVNFLVLYLRVFGSFTGIGIVNICLNALLLWAVYDIVRKLATQKAAYVAVIFFCLLPSNVLIAAVTMSDLFFAALMYIAISLFRRNPWTMLAAGLLTGLANYVRPVAILFIVPLVLYAVVRKFGIKPVAVFFTGMLTITALIGMINRQMTNELFVSGSTAGVNLIMSATDDGGGSYNDAVFEEGKAGFLGNGRYSVFEKDSIWKSRAIEWIKCNPGRYAANAPLKLARLWLGDSYHDLVLTQQRWVGWLKALTSVPYYILCILAMIGLWRRRRELFGLWGIYLIPLLGACAMHMLLYGGMRYHYPYIPIIILFATQAFCRPEADSHSKNDDEKNEISHTVTAPGTVD